MEEKKLEDAVQEQENSVENKEKTEGLTKQEVEAKQREYPKPVYDERLPLLMRIGGVLDPKNKRYIAVLNKEDRNLTVRELIAKYILEKRDDEILPKHFGRFDGARSKLATHNSEGILYRTSTGSCQLKDKLLFIIDREKISGSKDSENNNIDKYKGKNKEIATYVENKPTINLDKKISDTNYISVDLLVEKRADNDNRISEFNVIDILVTDNEEGGPFYPNFKMEKRV